MSHVDFLDVARRRSTSRSFRPERTDAFSSRSLRVNASVGAPPSVFEGGRFHKCLAPIPETILVLSVEIPNLLRRIGRKES